MTNYHYIIEPTKDGYKGVVQDRWGHKTVAAVSSPLLREVVRWIQREQQKRGDPIVNAYTVNEPEANYGKK